MSRRRREQWAGLIWTLVRTDFKTRYHGTLGGFGWALMKPLLMFVVLMAVFSFIFAGDPNYRLNLIVGLILWEFFAEGTKLGLGSLHAKGYLLSRARLPRWIVVLTSPSNPLITLAVFTLALLLSLAWLGRFPGWPAVGLLLCYELALLAIVVGFGLAASVLFLRYRDLNQVWEVVSQAGFFIAPIIYPLDILPERLHMYLYLWPPTPVIQFARGALIEGQPASASGHLLLACLACVSLGSGVLIHRWLEPGSMERL